MLRKIRVAVAVLMLATVTFYFIDFAGFLPWQTHALMHLQLIPALLALNIGVLVFLFLLTLLFGRAYCSFICPLGIWQDMISWLSKKLNKKKKYKFTKAKSILRYTLLAIVIVAFLSGLTVVLGLLDPYSIYGRISVNVFKPVYLLGNNLLATILEKFQNYDLYMMDVAVRSLVSLIVAILSLGIVSILSYKYGRLYCNSICPVGTFLGVISKYSLFKVRINKDTCNSCGLCETKCKSSCISSKEHTIDYSRCVDCFSCLQVCKKKALSFTYASSKKEQTVNDGRRAFLTLTGVGLAALPMAKAKETTAFLTNKKAYKKQHPLTPPGSVSTEHLLEHCTACHLCVSKCPSHVLTPAFLEYGLGGVMQPRMSFEKGFCNYDCTVCSSVCPNGAILPLTKEQKHLTQMGKVVFVLDNCIVHTDGTSCGACSEHCPTQAVSMKPYKGGLTIPTTNPDICVGCGGCEYVCPAKPYKAIYIEGNVVQQKAKPIEVIHQKEVDVDNFGF